MAVKAVIGHRMTTDEYAHNLLRNAKAAMLAATEVFNKPSFQTLPSPPQCAAHLDPTRTPYP